MADKLNEVFHNLTAFPNGGFLDLGDGFPTINYPFSQILFGDAKVVTRSDYKDYEVTTYLFLGIAIHL